MPNAEDHRHRQGQVLAIFGEGTYSATLRRAWRRTRPHNLGLDARRRLRPALPLLPHVSFPQARPLHTGNGSPIANLTVLISTRQAAGRESGVPRPAANRQRRREEVCDSFQGYVNKAAVPFSLVGAPLRHLSADRGTVPC